MHEIHKNLNPTEITNRMVTESYYTSNDANSTGLALLGWFSDVFGCKAGPLMYPDQTSHYRPCLLTIRHFADLIRSNYPC